MCVQHVVLACSAHAMMLGVHARETACNLMLLMYVQDAPAFRTRSKAASCNMTVGESNAAGSETSQLPAKQDDQRRASRSMPPVDMANVSARAPASSRSLPYELHGSHGSQKYAV